MPVLVAHTRRQVTPRRARRRVGKEEYVSNAPFRERLLSLERQEVRERAVSPFPYAPDVRPPSVMSIVCKRLGAGYFDFGKDRADTTHLQRTLGLREVVGRYREGSDRGSARDVLDSIAFREGHDDDSCAAARGAYVESYVRRYPPQVRSEVPYSLAVRLCRALDMDPHEADV